MKLYNITIKALTREENYGILGLTSEMSSLGCLRKGIYINFWIVVSLAALPSKRIKVTE